MRGSGTKSVAALVVAALLIAPLSAVAAVGLISYQDASDDEDTPDREDAPVAPVELAALLEPAAWVKSALGGEMLWQGARISGHEQDIDTPGPDSVRQTDEAVAAARAAEGSGEAEALATATDALADLGDVRAEADAIAASGTSPDVGQTPAAKAWRTATCSSWTRTTRSSPRPSRASTTPTCGWRQP